MLKKRFLVILLVVLALALIGVSVPIIIDNWPKISNTDGSKDHGYYKELTEFKFRITDYPDDTEYFISFPSPITAKYVKQEEVIDERESNIPYFEIRKMAYIFTESSNNTQISVLIPLGVADDIKMIPGEIYKIEYQKQYGFPEGYSLYFLTIQKGTNVIFLGLSDWDINYKYHLSDFLPIQASQTRVLSDHYIDGDFGWLRMTNTEIMFVLDGESVKLHQGQSAGLGDYEITLLIAREVEYDPKAYDAGQKSISYVISRKN